MTPGASLRITVAGAGAIGTALAARLGHGGHRVSVLARGATLQNLRTHGARLDDASGSVASPVTADSQPSFGHQDIVFLCCKSQDLPALAEQVAPLVGTGTLIVPAVNGVPFWYFHQEGGRFQGRHVEAVDPGGRIGGWLPLDQVIGAVTFITAESAEPGHTVARNPHLMMLGEPGNTISPRLLGVCAALEQSGIEARPIERLRDKLWTKIIANVTSNPLSVTSGATLDQIYSRPDLLPTVRAVMLETMLAACCHGARMTVDPIEFLKLGAAMGPIRTSMLQDFERGRPLELAAIGDAVLELAALFELPMTATREMLDRTRERCAAAVAAAA
ncbi:MULTISPECIES: ketopantoate reductase family protein [Pseudomonadota]|jgi:2-dehydropantoate 2-reductase|uniref:2-dehydropantoate 2-reductase n=1 Tax=Delftia acidovorans TaxID=80866 RepID=A0A7T2RYM8_DELAC|nr:MULTISPECIES: 2-dehydropantoate 2-reductase [Pseudomonadota]KJS67117.1 MAG: 2-dehydropantoate 2-reductase [Comamonadaceae bacterium BICA1-1]QPS05764.1 2-dehydropantoate 2-reductase [Delftia acidovorans]HCI3504584.1 2-dehydropantoate 2-reductase [Pseudomonas aeruginosa]